MCGREITKRGEEGVASAEGGDCFAKVYMYN